MRDCDLRIVLAAWSPFRAGAEVAAERLAVGLRDAGHQVTVVVGTRGETLQRLIDAGIDARHVPLAFTDKFKWLRYRAAQHALKLILNETAPDVVHANDLPTSQMIGQCVRRLGTPLVCHHRWVFDQAAIEWLDKFGADRHLFVSNALMTQLIGNCSRLAASCRSVVYDGLPLPPLPTNDDRHAARNKLGLPDDKKLVLFAGQLVERKGVADLLQAWRLLSDKCRETAQLLIVGDDLESGGKHRVELEQLDAELGCGARFAGYQKDVAKWIVAADLCVVPSHAEPLGNATLEAMAQGRAVIGSAVGGIPEMIVDGETGLLVSPHAPPSLAAAMERILADPALGNRLGQAARQRCAQKFSIETHVSSVVAEYRHVAARQLQTVR